MSFVKNFDLGGHIARTKFQAVPSEDEKLPMVIVLKEKSIGDQALYTSTGVRRILSSSADRVMSPHEL